MIPNILWQTWKTNKIPQELKGQCDSWKSSNPELDIRLYDDLACSKFIKENLGEEVSFWYEALPLPIMRADFWRIAIVYIHGGYYSDLDITCNISLKSLIRQDVSGVFTKELNNISNFFFGTVPKHPVLKLALDYMIEEFKSITDKDTQSFGMHSLHRAVREYYSVIGTDYPNNDQVQILNNEQLKNENKLIHSMSSLTGTAKYQSWRDHDRILTEKRNKTSDILFFTTFNRNGYELYGKKWIETFIKISNFYPSVKAKIYYEGIEPIELEHPNLNIVRFSKEIPHHKIWKEKFSKRSNHDDYVKMMTIKFSYKSFVIQDVLRKHNNDYLIWLDGDCVFKPGDYANFPKNVLGDKFLACQVEENWDLNHVESGILIFNGKHEDTARFNEMFTKNYSVEQLVPMGQPYDGFVVFRSLLMSKLKYVNLNSGFGRGGIQSDSNCTFLHPEIKNKFIHNIGWTGKHQYEEWDRIFNQDETYKHIQRFLFGNQKQTLDHKIKTVNEKLNSVVEKKKRLLARRG